MQIQAFLEEDGITGLPTELAWEEEDYTPESFAHYRCGFVHMLEVKHYLISGRVLLEDDLTYYSASVTEFKVSAYDPKTQAWLNFEFTYDIDPGTYTQEIPKRYEGKITFRPAQ
jgi:hypothetical protein